MTIFDDYGVLVKNHERFYLESLTERDFNLEGSTPVYFNFKADCLRDRSWIGIIPKIANTLQNYSPKSNDELLEYRTKWSKTEIFSISKKTNYSVLFGGFYINTNHTALHSVWLIQDLLVFYGVDPKECSLIIKRPPSVEPQDVKNYVIEEITVNFKSFLQNEKMDENLIINTLENMEIANGLLSSISKNYNNFYLLDNTLNLSNYKSRVIKYILKQCFCDENQRVLLKNSLDLFTKFCSSYFA